MTVATRYRDVIIILEIREAIREEWLASHLNNCQMYTESGPQVLNSGDAVINLEMRESIVKEWLCSYTISLKQPPNVYRKLAAHNNPVCICACDN